ncbi:MAG: DMT family transporter, partial [Chloroflexota bacterium]|nr:DMT family transporter [Chloroflexota bacterium]
AMLWGGNFAAIKWLLEDLEPLDVVFVRTVGAAFFFGLVLLLSGRPVIPLQRGDAARLVLIGVIGVTVLNLAVIFGQNLLPAALSSLIVTSNPVHTAVISRVLTGEPLTRRKVTGIALAFVGLAVVVLYGTGGEARVGTGQIKGVLILAVAPFSWALYTVLSKPVLARYPSVHIAAYTTIVGSLGFLPLPLLRGGMVERIGGLSLRGWGAALFVTLISFVAAYILWYRGLRVLAPSQAAVYIYFVPVFGLLAAWLLLGETITPYLLLGGATILAGVILTNSGHRPAPTAEIGPEAARTPTGPGRLAEEAGK